MTDTATTTPSYAPTFVVLFGVNVATLAAVYAVLMDDGSIRTLIAAALLATVIIAQVVRCGPGLPLFAWASTIPIAVALAYLIGAHPGLDWSDPGEPDRMDFAPILPMITVAYAIGFTLIASAFHLGYSAIQRHYPRLSG